MFHLKDTALLFFRYLLINFLTYFLTELIGYPLALALNLEGTAKKILSGPYYWYQIIASIMIFYLLLLCLFRKRYPYKVKYLESQVHNLHNKNLFDFKTNFRINFQETLHTNLWKYALFNIFPFITCSFSWILGAAPQELLLNHADGYKIANYSLEFFTPQHAYFDLFYQFGIFSVFIGLFLNISVYWVIYSWITTIAQKKVYNQCLTKE